jgi:hypothetical protein
VKLLGILSHNIHEKIYRGYYREYQKPEGKVRSGRDMRRGGRKSLVKPGQHLGVKDGSEGGDNCDNYETWV